MKGRLILAGFAAIAVMTFAASSVRADYGDQSDFADQNTPVQVTLPEGFTSTTNEVRPGPTAATKYLIINALRVTNQSRLQPLSVDYKDFVLRDFFGYDTAYHIDVRYTKALPTSLPEGSLGPGQFYVGAIAYLVPATMRKALLWYYVYQFDATYPTY
jgi:hypothetical protein